MDLFQRKICRDKNLASPRRPQHSAIIANARSHYTGAPRAPANGGDEGPLARNQRLVRLSAHRTSILRKKLGKQSIPMSDPNSPRALYTDWKNVYVREAAEAETGEAP